MTAATDPLKLLGELAVILDSPEVNDVLSPAMKRGIREASDTLRITLEDQTGGTLSIPTLISFYIGASFQAAAYDQENPAASMVTQVLGGGLPTKKPAEPRPADTINLCVAYLARDLLAGERIG